MPNTGLKVYQWLRQIDLATGLPTGVRKPNDPADPDYIPPVTDHTSCPVAPPPTFSWIVDTFTCEQDSIFVLASQVTGLSSPQGVYYDETLDRYYVVDVDDPNGNFWWFNPDTFASYGDVTHIAGLTDWVYGHQHDPETRRIFATGRNTNGLKVLDIATGGITTVAYGNNGNFSRILVKLLGNVVYCGNQIGGNTLTLVDKNTLTVLDTLDIDGGDIPSGPAYFNNDYSMTLVNGNEIWVTANSRTTAEIAIYDISLTTLIATISQPGSTTIPGWGYNRYWQSSNLDQEKNKFYCYDMGSSTLRIYDTITRSLVHSIPMNNRGDKPYAACGVVSNPLTNDRYISYSGLTDPNDTMQDRRTYKIDRDSYEFQSLLPGVNFFQLTNRTGTGEFWGAQPGNVVWQGTSNWQTDGIMSKFMQ